MRSFGRKLATVAISLAALAAPVRSQTTTSVTVDTAAPLATLQSTAFGVDTAVRDANLTDPVVPA
jgi:hypothetical protein